SRWFAATSRSSTARGSPLEQFPVERKKAVGGARDVLAPMGRGVLIRTVAHVFRAGECRAFDEADLRERERLHVDDVAGDGMRLRRERVARATDRVGQVRKAGGKLEHRRQCVERGLAGRKAERGDVHVAIDEAAAGNERACGYARAPRRAEIHDEWQCSPGAA